MNTRVLSLLAHVEQPEGRTFRWGLRHLTFFFPFLFFLDFEDLMSASDRVATAATDTAAAERTHRGGERCNSNGVTQRKFFEPQPQN